MTWRDELRPASFRGVPFFVKSVTRTETLHADEQVFPGRSSAGDAVHVEHLGAGPERFSIDAYVVGDEYRAARDALEAALRQPGSGRLVHPYRGELVVSVIGQISTTEGPDRGGFARITWTAVVTESPTLRRAPDTEAVIERDLDAFLDRLAGDFAETYDDELPEQLQASSRDAFADAVASLEGIYRDALGGIGQVNDFANDVGAATRELDSFIADPLAAVQSLIVALGRITSAPERILGSVVSVEGRGATVVATLIAAVRPLIRFGEDLAEIVGLTPDREIERENLRAVVQVVRGAAIGQTVLALATLPFDSRSEAIAVRDELAEAFDRVVDEGTAGGSTPTGAELFEALARARAATVEHLSAVARTLPELMRYRAPATLPALVIAHELYGDARRADEILARNLVPKPHRIPVGTEIEVVRRG